jgi:hypothetical protein
MDLKKADRSTLKSYFVKNAIPTESNFADLIDALINQKDDGLTKLAGEPLSVQADGEDASQKKAINFYRSFADAKPAWSLSLNPRSDPANAATAKPGWSVGDADGNSKLFIDQTTGRLGVGTVSPAEALEVNGRAKIGTMSVGPWPANGDYGFLGASTLNQAAQGNYALLQGNSDGPGRTFLNSPIDIHFRIGNVDKMVMLNNGNFGIGAADPRAKLEVRGGAIMPTAGNTAAAGIQFPPDPGGGGGDAAWLRFYPRSGEACTLELGTSNDGDDHISLMPSGNVGIGTLTPANKLDVMGDVAILNKHAFRGSDTWLRLNQDGAFPNGVHTPGLFAPMALNVGGAIGFGSPGTGNGVFTGNVKAASFTGILLSGNGKYFVTMQDDRNFVLYNVSGGAVWSSSTSVSDVRLKKDIRTLDNAVANLQSLRGIAFSWKDSELGEGDQIGVVAQEVEQVYPTLVSTIQGRKLVNYQGLIPVLIEAVKEQQLRIGDLQSEIRILKSNG